MLLGQTNDPYSVKIKLLSETNMSTDPAFPPNTDVTLEQKMRTAHLKPYSFAPRNKETKIQPLDASPKGKKHIKEATHIDQKI